MAHNSLQKRKQQTMKGHQINMKLLAICFCMTLLIGCTSKSLSVRYYLLHTPEKNLSDNMNKEKPIVVLQLLDVAEYLRQTSLVMQVEQNQLYYSRQDVWAENLQTSFYQALLQDLNATGQRNYVALSAPEAIDATTSISVKLAHFHATDKSSVVSSGRYWLSATNAQAKKNNKRGVASHTFFFESELKQDGYAQAVKQLRMLVTSLAEQIEKDIAALPNN